MLKNQNKYSLLCTRLNCCLNLVHIVSTILLLSIFSVSTSAQVGLNLKSTVRKITLQKIIVKGNKTVDKGRILNSIDLQKGEEYLPPVLKRKVREAIIDLNKMGLFSNISVDIEYPDDVDGIYLTILNPVSHFPRKTVHIQFRINVHV